MDLIKEVGDTLVPGLRLTVDLPELHKSGKVPMLDIQVWLEQDQDHSIIRHSFYQKPSTSPLVFHAGGAHNWRSKLITLVEELRRRYLHMDGRHSMEDKKEVISDYLQKLSDSGYTHPTRMEIVKSATLKYYRQVLDQEAGGPQIYRSSEEMAGSRKVKELMNKTWFRSKRGGQ